MWVSSYDTWGASAARKWGHETIKYTANSADEGIGKGMSQSYFTSHYMLDMGATGSFEVAQFHIHHKSEHTVEGEQMDLEIHWVHFADGLAEDNLTPENKNDYAIASALGIMFSLDADLQDEPELEATTFAFLDWIKADLEADPTSAGDPAQADKSGVAPLMDDLLHAVDWNNRWSYSGSLTTPPCTVNVQHNVLRKVLPIRQEHVDAVKAFTEANAPDFYTNTEGNWRVIVDLQPEADAVLLTDADPNPGLYQSLYVVFLLLFIVTLLGIGTICYMMQTVSGDISKGSAAVNTELANQ